MRPRTTAKSNLLEPHDIVLRRLQNQRLVGKPFREPAQVVSWHLAMQSQDFAGAKWALGQRLATATDARVEAAFDQGLFVRTHVLRPTWHFVAPADARWLLELTAPRIRAFSAPYFRKHGLDAKALKRSRRALEKCLAGARHLTRDELASELSAAKLPVEGEALSYQLIAAELDAVIVSGPRRGKQHTYALLDERVAPSPRKRRDEALAELALRYLQGHGPALPRDLAWWASLTVADAKRGLAACAKQLDSVQVAGKTYWFAPLSRAFPEADPFVHLLPNYDEQLIAYRFRGNAIDPKVTGSAPPSIFDGHLLAINGLLVGGWRRELTSTHVHVTARPLRRLSRAEQRALSASATRYANFLGLELMLSVDPTY